LAAVEPAGPAPTTITSYIILKSFFPPDIIYRKVYKNIT
jgi:hypothetical protein